MNDVLDGGRSSGKTAGGRAGAGQAHGNGHPQDDGQAHRNGQAHGEVPGHAGGGRPPGGPVRPGALSGDWRSRVPGVFAWVLGILSAVCAAAAISEAFDLRMHLVRRAIDLLLMPAPANLGYAAFIGVLAVGVSRRKQVAYWFLITYFLLQLMFDSALTVVLHLPRAFWDNEPPRTTPYAVWFVIANLVLTLGVLIVLWRARSAFFARVQTGSVPKALVTLASGLTVSVLLGWGLVEVAPGSLRDGSDRLTYTAERVIGGAFVFDITRRGHAPGWVNLVLGLLGAISLFAALLVLFRSQRLATQRTVGEERHVRELLARYGERDSLGYFATRRDKVVIFSPSGKAAVTYRVVTGVSLASGDPLGDPEAWGPAIEAWLRQAREYAWTPAVIGASETGATAYARHGLRVLELGDEAIVHVKDFTLQGREMRPVRQAVNRIERAGYRARIRRHCDISPEEMERVIQLAAHWRDTETERGYSMALGRLGDPSDGRCVLVEALDRFGEEVALLSFVPWGARGLSLDLMRRDRTSDNGMVEFLVAALVADAPRLGVERISMNFAAFRAAFEEGARIGAGPVLRAWRRVLLFVSRWFQLESLYRSNVKYRPEWLPRFVCYEDIHDLGKVSFASLLAEGFVTQPSLDTLLRRGRSAPATVDVLPRPMERIPSITNGDLIAALPADLVPGAVVPVDTATEAAGPGTGTTATARGAAPAAGAPGAGAPGAPGAGEPGGPGELPGLPELVNAWEAAPEQVRIRLAKLEKLVASGVDPYPPGLERTDACGTVHTAHRHLPPDTRTGERVAVAGRVVLLRNHGRLCFATLRDWSGDLQVMIDGKVVGAGRLLDWKSMVDIGDHVLVTGEVITSRRGEVSVAADSWTLAAKCLRPLPDKHAGLADAEARVRQRYVDLIVNPDAREAIRVRSSVLHALRGALVDRGYLEVETPMLQSIHGGANARPFMTDINAYKQRVYLRIAPELYLKRLAVGGVERVFELGRNFRNEGADATHNPEFSMLEAYQAYADYTVMRELTRELIVAAATATYGAPVARRPDGDVDLSGPWRVVGVHEAVGAALGAGIDPGTPIGDLHRLADAAGVPYDPVLDRGHLVLELYEHLVEASTVEPTFYVDFPVEVSPLTRAHRTDPRLAERWDLVAFGMEVGTAYTELVDPVEQRRRLTAQSLLAAGGDPEAMELDEDFLHALEYAMPPTGGLGLGVDRIIMMLTGRLIRQALPFPFVRQASAPKTTKDDSAPFTP